MCFFPYRIDDGSDSDENDRDRDRGREREKSRVMVIEGREDPELLGIKIPDTILVHDIFIKIIIYVEHMKYRNYQIFQLLIK